MEKKELKTVLSPDLYDELRFVFRPELLENVIYKPEIINEKKWQCCCGSENELDVCPICGMEKNTVFSKLNAGYLARHRKARIAKKKKAIQDQQAMMAAQMLRKTGKQKKDDEKTRKLGTIIGVVVLCIAIVCSILVLLDDSDEIKNPVDTVFTAEKTDKDDPNNTSAPKESDSPDATTPPESETNPAESETTPPEVTAPVVPVEVPSVPATGHVATIGDGKWATGATGNVSAGGRVHTDSQYDYVAKDGITVLDKSGNIVTTLTENKALCITGSGSYIFYVDENYSVHRIDTTNKDDVTFAFKAKSITVYKDELYYIPSEGPGFFAVNFYGDTTKIITKTLNIYAMTVCADKLYFSTDESLAVISSEDGNVTTFCADGAKATSILEITQCVFYVGTDGRLKFFNPYISYSFGVEYPMFHVLFTHVTAYDNRVYVRTYDPATGQTLWISTVWTPGTQLFSPAVFRSTGVTTNELYVTGSAVYDGYLNRYSVS